MDPEVSPSLGEREQTDQSLRVERAEVDQEFLAKRAAIDEVADAVICRARERADQVVAAARTRADQSLMTSGLGPQATTLIARERTLADEALRAERLVADEARHAERAEHVAVLAKDRADTDNDLSHERSQVDDALTTRDQFLGLVGHEVRNMLHAMLGFAELIETGASCENPASQSVFHAQSIRRAGARMNRLIGDLVDIASIEAGMLVVTPKLEDPGCVVAEAVENLQAQASTRSISLRTEATGRLEPVLFDAARILQVLVNLLSNAIKFTPDAGTIVIRVENAGADIHFSVSDTGIGIPSDKQEAVFERFIQIEKNDQRGVGLGLYISRSIVQRHGGRMWVESKIGEGSTFHFTLPARRSAAHGLTK
jgi:signal transduction histidine kinase